ncbi:MAG: hypothetical protein KGK16_10630 [Bradyrhizobium sp.]|nr:hypothetical protein [Bradyrhizobium sp.]
MVGQDVARTNNHETRELFNDAIAYRYSRRGWDAKGKTALSSNSKLLPRQSRTGLKQPRHRLKCNSAPRAEAASIAAPASVTIASMTAVIAICNLAADMNCHIRIARKWQIVRRGGDRPLTIVKYGDSVH